MKLTVVVLGGILVILVFFVERLGQVYQLSLTLSSITTGTMLGIFTMGMVSRKANNKGALIGGIVSVLVVTIMTIGAGSIREDPMLPMRSDGCHSAVATVKYENWQCQM